MSEIAFSCPWCGQHLKAPPDIVGEVIACPSCEKTVKVPPPDASSNIKTQRMPRRNKRNINMAKVVKKRQTSAAGLLLELIGLAMLFCWNVNPIISLLGIGLLIAGISKSKKYICSRCGNKVEDKDVKMCPVCNAQLGK